MIKTELYLNLSDPRWKTVFPEAQEVSEQVVSLVVNFINDNEPLDFFALDKTLTFNLCLSNDSEVQNLNQTFRQINKPTNVLSFANIDDEDFAERSKIEPEIEMGDMIIALETMQHEAQEKRLPLYNHFCHLLTHSVLHLLGYDHIQDDEAQHMEDFEIKILRQLKINNPYEE